MINSLYINTKKEPVKIAAYFFLFIVAAWIFPRPVVLAGWLGVFIYFFRSKHDYLWITFFFIISQIGGLFVGGAPSKVMLFASLGGRAVSIIELVIALFIVKEIFKPSNGRFIFKNWIIYVLLFSAWLLLYGIVDGMATSKVFRVARFLVPWGLFWFIPKQINTRDKIVSVVETLSYFVILIFILQLIETFLGFKLTGLLGGGLDLDEVDRDTSRKLYGIMLTLVTMVGLMILEYRKWIIVSKNFAFIVILIGYLSIIISATRGYWLSSTLLVGYYLFFIKSIPKSVSKIIPYALILIVVLSFVPKIQDQFVFAIERFSTLKSIVNEEDRGLQNERRLEERLPRVWGKYVERPILGFGFSDQGFEYQDKHVAFATTLLLGGIPGMFLWLSFWTTIIITFGKQYSITNDKSNSIVIVGLLAFLICGNTSTTVFTFLIESRAFYLALFFSFANFVYLNPIIDNKKAIKR